MRSESPTTLEPLNTVGAPPRTSPTDITATPLTSVATTTTTILATNDTVDELTEIEIPVDMIDDIFDPETAASILAALPSTTTSTTETPIPLAVEETSTSTLDTMP